MSSTTGVGLRELVLPRHGPEGSRRSPGTAATDYPVLTKYSMNFTRPYINPCSTDPAVSRASAATSPRPATRATSMSQMPETVGTNTKPTDRAARHAHHAWLSVRSAEQLMAAAQAPALLLVTPRAPLRQARRGEPHDGHRRRDGAGVRAVVRCSRASRRCSSSTSPRWRTGRCGGSSPSSSCRRRCRSLWAFFAHLDHLDGVATAWRPSGAPSSSTCTTCSARSGRSRRR